jgi:hypothetical protein
VPEGDKETLAQRPLFIPSKGRLRDALPNQLSDSATDKSQKLLDFSLFRPYY